MKTNKQEPMQYISNIILIFLSLSCLLPFLLLVISSFTEEKTLIYYGYKFFPKKVSLDAYKYLLEHSSVIGRGYAITALITIVGTTISLIITSMLAYPLSRKDTPLRNPLSFVVYFTMLFNGGLVPTYIMYTRYFGIKNTLWGLLVPSLLMNGFNVIITRTYFKTNIPDAVIESAVVDGAGQFMTFRKIVIPLSFPIMATIGLFAGLAYWNDWYNGLIYLTNAKLFSIQNILNRIMTDLQFLSNTNFGTTTGQVASLPETAVRMAIATVGMVPILIAYPFFQKYFVKGITIGAVKG